MSTTWTSKRAPSYNSLYRFHPPSFHINWVSNESRCGGISGRREEAEFVLLVLVHLCANVCGFGVVCVSVCLCENDMGQKGLRDDTIDRLLWRAII